MIKKMIFITIFRSLCAVDEAGRGKVEVSRKKNGSANEANENEAENETIAQPVPRNIEEGGTEDRIWNKRMNELWRYVVAIGRPRIPELGKYKEWVKTQKANYDRIEENRKGEMKISKNATRWEQLVRLYPLLLQSSTDTLAASETMTATRFWL